MYFYDIHLRGWKLNYYTKVFRLRRLSKQHPTYPEHRRRLAEDATLGPNGFSIYDIYIPPSGANAIYLYLSCRHALNTGCEDRNRRLGPLYHRRLLSVMH